MRRSYKVAFSVFILTVAAIFYPVRAVHARSTPATIPPDFVLIDSAPGVDLYRKDYAGGTPDYVLVVDLSKKAGVKLLHGDFSGSGSNPSFNRQSLQQYWDAFSAADSRATCVVNGTAFAVDADPTLMTFPIKVDDQLIAAGAPSDNGRMLEIWSDHARISTLSAEELAASSAANILGGLAEDAGQDSNALIGRSMVGVMDGDGSGSAETLLFLSSKTSRVSEAAGVLRSFGAEAVMLLDGGDSAQMLCTGQPWVYSDRTIPQVVGIYAGEQAAYSMKVVRQTDWEIVVQGQTADIELTLTNTGSETWHTGEVTLVNKRNDWNAGSILNLPSDVAPRGKVTLGWTTPPFEKTGVFVSQWDMVRGSQVFSEKPILIHVIVIPPELESKKAELEAKIREWAQQQTEDIEQMIMEWIQSQVRKGIQTICPLSAALPGVVIATGVWQSLRKRRK